MPLIRDNGHVEDDRWVRLDGDAALPEDGTPVIVGLARWKAEREALLRRNAPLGVALEAGEDVEEVAGDLDRLALVALVFPKFADGRAYSSARILRERYGFAGELRAVGNVLRDQLLFMHRCGFSSYDIAADDAAEAWAQALGQFSVWYQPTADGRPSAAQLRTRRAAPPARAQRPSRPAAPGVRAPARRDATAASCAGNWAY